MSDNVNHPAHYNNSRFGIECIAFTGFMTFNAGNSFKYVWRHLDKGKPVEDLEKALVYNNWAWHNYLSFDTLAILPGFEIHLRILSDQYLVPVAKREPVFGSLISILDNEYNRARDTVRAELVSLG